MQGGHVVVLQGLNSDTKVEKSYPSCSVAVYDEGTATLSTIYADNSGTVKGNPFTSDSNGYWFFYADNGRYDVHFYNSDIATPFTRGDYLLCDPSDPTGAFSCTGGGGSATPACSTSVQGSLSVIPQTCAGEKTLQGIAGNPLLTNFTVLPASDQVGVNTWSGPLEVSFTNPDTSRWPGGAFLNNGFNVMTSLNQGSNTGSGFPFGHDSALMLYNEDNTHGGDFGILALDGVCNSTATTGNTGNMQCVVGEAYNSGAGTVSFMDGGSFFATNNGGNVGVLSSVYVGRAVGPASDQAGLYIESQAGCGAGGGVTCKAWEYGSSYLDASENLVIGGNLTVEGNLTHAINPVAFSSTPTFDVSKGDVQTITLTGDVTSSDMTNCYAGWIVTFDIIEDGAGGHAFVAPPNLHGVGAIDTTGGYHNRQMFYCTGGSSNSEGYSTTTMMSGG